jgi:glycine/D-amino acid oxidase-like deaminating enzyme
MLQRFARQGKLLLGKNLMLSATTELPSSVDLAIIGGGVIGTVTAYTLAKAGFRVVVIERKDIGAGTSSSAAAAALLQTKTSAQKLSLANQSLKLLDDLHNQIEEKFEYAHTGSLLAANTDNELQLVHDMNINLKSLGLDVEYLDGKQARQYMPVLGENVIGASYSPHDAQINPLELVSACAQAARLNGAILATFTELLGIETSGDRVIAINTSAGRVLTDTVINAAGVWAPQVAHMANISLPVSPLKGELLITERRPPQMHGTLIAAKYLLSKARAEENTDGQAAKRSVGITLVQVAHGNFVVGSTRDPDSFDKRSTYIGIRELVHQLIELTPSLANVHLLRAYAGLRPLTPDGSPIIGRTPQLPGLVQAAGFGGDGLAMSAITADMILGIMTGNQDDKLLANFSLDRFETSETTS